MKEGPYVYKEDKSMMAKNPDKGVNGQASGSRNSEKYRGNDYEEIYEKCQKSDSKKIARQMKEYGYR